MKARPISGAGQLTDDRPSYGTRSSASCNDPRLPGPLEEDCRVFWGITAAGHPWVELVAVQTEHWTDLTPDQARRLATALSSAADEADARARR